MSQQGSLTVRCSCAAGRATVVLAYMTDGRTVRLYDYDSDGFTVSEYLVDQDQPVTLPEPDQMSPDDRIPLYKAHARWELRCDFCRHPLVARSTKLLRAISLLRAIGRTEVSVAELEAVLSDPRVG